MNKAFPLESKFFDMCTVWSFRISNVSDLAIDTTFKGFEPWSQRLIVSEETSSKGVLHHHGLVVFRDQEQAKDDISFIIKQIYPDAKGNKSIYIALAQKKNQLLKYTIKEGKYLQMGFSTEFMNAALKLSSSKEGMDKAFINLLDSLKLEQITFKQYIAAYIKLKVEHNQPLYSNHLIAYFRTVLFKVDPDRLESYAERLEEKILFDN